MKWERIDTFGTIVIVLILIGTMSFVGWDESDDEPEDNTHHLRIEYIVNLKVAEGSSFTAIVPFPSNDSLPLKPSLSLPWITKGNGSFEIIDTIFGNGLQITSNGSIRIVLFENITWEWEFQNMENKPDFRLSDYRNITHYRVIKYGDFGYVAFYKLFLDNSSDLNTIMIKNIRFQSTYYGGVNSYSGYYGMFDETFTNGWNNVRGYWSQRMS